MSDGELEPVEAIGVYREAGYDFIAISEHRKVGHLWQDENFLILPGVEWDTGDAIHMPVYHILGIGMNRETADFYHGAPYEGAPLGNTREKSGPEAGAEERNIIRTRRQSSMQSGQQEESLFWPTRPGQ